MGFRLLLLNVIAAAANMAESGVKVDSSSSVVDPKELLTNSMVAKSAREKRRKIIADRKAKRCTDSESNVVSPITESMVTQVARERRRQIIAAKKAMRCTNNVQSSRRKHAKQDKNSKSSDKKRKHEASEAEAPRQKPQIYNPPTDAEKEMSCGYV